MVKFAHLGDCHLGSWRQPELQQLNLESFRFAIDHSIKEGVDFVLIAGDLFDSAYPPIEILKETFKEFRKLFQAKIPCYLIAGSHDFSASGKTFLDVLENSGFCKNVARFEERENQIILQPTLDKNVAIYGYPGKKSGLEVEDLKKIKLNETPGFYHILMLHTTISSAVGSLPIESISEESLPKANYYALGHLHIEFNENNFVYSGPIFPNNFQELEDLQEGSFYIVNTDTNFIKRVPIKLKNVKVFDIEITDTLLGTQKITSTLDKTDIQDKIVLLRVSGNLKVGKHSDLNFAEIERFVQSKKVYSFLKNTTQLVKEEQNLEIRSENMENIETEVIEKYQTDNKTKFDTLVPNLLDILSIEKHEDEKSSNYEERLIGEVKKILSL